MEWMPLSRTDGGVFKGIAILMIATHNFMHAWPPRENEFFYSSQNVSDLLNLLANEPENIVRITLSFFGHFGVQVFIFLSAYGLAKKYASRQIEYGSFLWSRYVKIMPAFVLAILLWALVRGWLVFGVLGPVKLLYWKAGDIALKLTLLSGFTDTGTSLVGPWWFIGFVFQFYAVFPLMLWAHKRWGAAPLLAIAAAGVACKIVLGGTIGSHGVLLMATVLGHLPELCLGIYVACRDDSGLQVSSWWLVAAAIVFVLGNSYEPFWSLSHLSFLIILLALFSAANSWVQRSSARTRFFLWVGRVSMALFLVNGFLRAPWIGWAIEYDHWAMTIVFCGISLATSFVAAVLLTKAEGALMSRFRKKRPVAAAT